jgi:hypothetical protein
MLKVCPWCAAVISTDSDHQPDCPHCRAEGHLYRTVDDGVYGIAWLRERWQGWPTGLDHLARAEQALHAAKAAQQEAPDAHC